MKFDDGLSKRFIASAQVFPAMSMYGAVYFMREAYQTAVLLHFADFI